MSAYYSPVAAVGLTWSLGLSLVCLAVVGIWLALERPQLRKIVGAIGFATLAAVAGWFPLVPIVCGPIKGMWPC